MFANCIDEISGRGCVSNNFGFYYIKVGLEARILVSCIGYETTLKEYKINRDTIIDIVIKPKVVDINEVVVSATIPEREQVQMGKSTLTPEMIRSIPTFLAEPDLIKSLSYLPGISLGREGYSNIFVRGGDRGQNLILLDGIKIYNTGHVGGFLSLFNCDIVKSVDVYKGGFPAQYGGRTASVVDVYTKEGNSQKTVGKVTLGTLTSSAIIESPIGKNISFFLAGRTMYYDLLMASKLKDFENAEKKGAPLSSIEYNSFSFYEINGKIRWRLSSSSSLAFTFFISDDWIKNYGQENYEKEYSSFRNSLKNERYKDNYCIGNKGLSLTHVKNFGSLFWKNTFSMSDYNTESDNLSDEDIGKKSHVMYKTKIITEIKDITYQSRIEYNTGIHKVKSGIEINHYNFNPGFKVYEYDVDTISSDVSESGYHTNSKAWENSFYINDEIGITDNYSLECGVRTTLYHISNFNYKSFEPRISMRYLLSNNLSLKMNYTSMSQYNHVMVNNNNGAEEEVWIASTKGVKPQKANQVSVGLFYGNDDKRVNMSVEAYYKQMKDLIEYRSLYDEEE